MIREDFDQLDSTQLEVKRRLAAGDAPPGPFLVVARHQEQGRGRLGRSWTGLDGHTLMFSIWLPLDLSVEKYPLVSLASGLALSRWLDNWLPKGMTTRIKWPNDILAPDGKKLAGILCEGHWSYTVPVGVIVGIGINVSWPAEFDRDAEEIANSGTLGDYINGERALDFDVLHGALGKLAEQIQQHCDFIEKNTATLISGINDRLAKYARPVTWKSFESDPCLGYIESVSASGKLRFRALHDQRVLEIDSGELLTTDQPL